MCGRMWGRPLECDSIGLFIAGENEGIPHSDHLCPLESDNAQRQPPIVGSFKLQTDAKIEDAIELYLATRLPSLGRAGQHS